MKRVGIKRYLIALKLIFSEVKNPLSASIRLIFASSPYTIRIRVDHTVISGDKLSILEKLMEIQIKRMNPDGGYVYHCNRKSYYINGYNSIATIFSTFIFEDWKKLNVKGRIVLDIGGYVGDTAIYFAAKGANRVIMYEAFPYSYKIAKKNISQNNLSDIVEVNNCALGGMNSFITIDPNYINDNESKVVTFPDGIKIPVITLKDIVEKYNITDCSLKMNCEGCEYEVFDNTDIETFRKFSEIYMHYHADPAPLVEKLNLAGFEVKVDDYIYAVQ